MDKNEIIKLIESWSCFCDESTNHDLEDFAIWLLEKKRKKLKRNQMIRDACYLLFRIERYHKVQVKNLFHGLPLLGYEDFLLLNTVYHNPNIPKKELYEVNIYDMNSGTQTVNRLKRERLLVDTQSRRDKRVYLLNVTEEGRKVRDEAFNRFEKTLSQKFFTLSDKEFMKFHDMLQKVERQFDVMGKQTSMQSQDNS